MKTNPHEPPDSDEADSDDPFYALGDIVEPTVGSLSNEDIDRIIYCDETDSTDRNPPR
jgi:hypothetical protein